MNRMVTVSTKVDKDSKESDTIVTFVWPEGIPAWCMAGFEAYATVKLQGRWRKAGQIPAKVTVNAVELAPGAKATVDPEAIIAALSPEQRAALLAKYAK